MTNFYDSVKNKRQLKSLTGLDFQKFETLLQLDDQVVAVVSTANA